MMLVRNNTIRFYFGLPCITQSGAGFSVTRLWGQDELQCSIWGTLEWMSFSYSEDKVSMSFIEAEELFRKYMERKLKTKCVPVDMKL